MAPSTTNQRAKKPAPPKSSNTGLIVVIVVAVVAVIAIVAAVVSQLGKDSGAEGLSQTQSVAVEGPALARYDAATTDPSIGAVPPTLRGSSFDGSPITIDPADGKAKLVVFFAHWCPVCQREVPVLVDWINAGKVPPDLEVIGVSTAVDSSRDNYPPSSWLERVGWTKPVLADAKDSIASASWGLPAYPYFVLLDADGKVVARDTGALTVEQLDQLVAQVSP